MTRKYLTLFVTVLALTLSLALWSPGRQAAASTLNYVTNLMQVYFSVQSVGPVVRINQRYGTGTTTATPPGDLIRAEYKATPVFRLDKNGNIILKAGAVVATETNTPTNTPTSTATPTVTPTNT